MRSQCPKCNNLLETPATWQDGQAVRCPHCQEVFVPVAAPQPPIQMAPQAGTPPSDSRDTPWAVVLLVIGLLDLLANMTMNILANSVSGFLSTAFSQFWYFHYGNLILPALAIICSIFYFADKRRKPKRIAWEYIGIVMAYYRVYAAISYFIVKKIIDAASHGG